MDPTTQANRRAWETASRKYVLEHEALLAEVAAGSSLLGLEHDLLREVLRGSPDVVHWQSGNGTDDIGLVQMGAKFVVGVDYSEVAVGSAQRRAIELGVPCRYVVAELPGAPLAEACADLVYTGKGALIWSPTSADGRETSLASCGRPDICSSTKSIPRRRCGRGTRMSLASERTGTTSPEVTSTTPSLPAERSNGSTLSARS
ncbi:class I SAM-dependent methyltransferase [Actinoplanes siamensis]|uniref:Methyltransferase n=1 Tax=Actinoplanes siamensis TaxID=1223317 RepID=A0A919N645_9ACTN|nr:class I SAM-dependent methyltransferase [Actinoplanes siamensis]GIF05026.1 hypothetical protein Asi03nite_25640 [Actinoplanes siamensis]